MSKFDEARALTQQAADEGTLPNLGALSARDLIGVPFVITSVSMQDSRFGDNKDYAIVQIEREDGIEYTVNMSGSWLVPQLKALKYPDHFGFLWTIREMKEKTPFQGYYPLSLDAYL